MVVKCVLSPTRARGVPSPSEVPCVKDHRVPSPHPPVGDLHFPDWRVLSCQRCVGGCLRGCFFYPEKCVLSPTWAGVSLRKCVLSPTRARGVPSQSEVPCVKDHRVPIPTPPCWGPAFHRLAVTKLSKVCGGCLRGCFYYPLKIVSVSIFGLAGCFLVMLTCCTLQV